MLATLMTTRRNEVTKGRWESSKRQNVETSKPTNGVRPFALLAITACLAVAPASMAGDRPDTQEMKLETHTNLMPAQQSPDTRPEGGRDSDERSQGLGSSPATDSAIAAITLDAADASHSAQMTLARARASVEQLANPPVLQAELTHDHTDDEIGHCGGVQVFVLDGETPARKNREGGVAGGGLTIDATFDDNVNDAARAVIWQAINEWIAIIDDSGATPDNYSIDFEFGNLPGNQLGLTSVWAQPFCALGYAEMTFRIDGNWFIDPTPWDDTEFINGAAGPPGFDFLTVVRHEIGHALGFTQGSCLTTGRVINNVFDPGFLNVPITFTGGFHTDPNTYPNDLMVPSVSQSVRRGISLYPDASLLAMAMDYGLRSVRFVNNWFLGGDNNGSAQFPWTRMADGFANVPEGGTLLIAPHAYDEPLPVFANRSLGVIVTRGGSAYIGPP